MARLAPKFIYTVIFMLTSASTYWVAFAKYPSKLGQIHWFEIAQHPTAFVNLLLSMFGTAFWVILGPTLLFYLAARRAHHSPLIAILTMLNLMVAVFCVYQLSVQKGPGTDFFFAIYWASSWLTSIAAAIFVKSRQRETCS